MHKQDCYTFVWGGCKDPIINFTTLGMWDDTVVIPAISYHSSVFIMFAFILNTLIYDVKSSNRPRAKLHSSPAHFTATRRDTLTFAAAACGIISSCISTFYTLSCQFSVKQINPGRGLQFPLGCRPACKISAPDASLTRTDSNIYHVRVLTSEVLQHFRHMCDFDLQQRTPGSCWTCFLLYITPGPFSRFAYLWACEVFFLDLETPLRRSLPPSNLDFCFQQDHFGGVCWLRGATLLPAHSSPHSQVKLDMIFPACEIQSKQQLAMFSSLCFSADPLLKACSSLGRNPGDIPTHCFSDTH